jgi:beta-lactamase class A
MNRRAVLRSAVGFAVLAACRRSLAADEFHERLAAVEKAAKSRLGVAVLDTGTGRKLAYRGAERFSLLSTWKVLAAGCVLARVDQGADSLARRVTYSQSSVLSYAPVTKLHVRDGMTIGELCAAALELSDNTAANVLLESCGGPKGLTAWLRAIGDGVTRLDRTEPTLNEARPGDPRDTTTPSAVADTLDKLLLGNILSAASRRQLAAWMIACKTGTNRLRAGLPPGWRVGDKTGTNDTGCANDLAIAWPPGRAPLIIACYLADAGVPPRQRDAAQADVAKIAATWRAA